MSNEDLQKQIEQKKAELKIEAPVIQPEVSEVVEEPAKDPILEEAIKMGYNPNYEGPNKKTPEQFVKDGSFFRKIDAQNKKIDEMAAIIKQLDEHNRKVQEAAYKKGMQDAMQKRQEAVELGDVEAFHRAEAEIKSMQEAAPVAQPVVQQPVNNNVVTQDMLDFVESNKSWFNNATPENERMVLEADGLFALESKYNPHKTQKEILEIVKEKIMALHPEKFENPNKSRPVSVTKSSVSVTGSSKDSALVARLTESQLQFIKSAQARGVKMTVEEYAKQLDMTGDLKND